MTTLPDVRTLPQRVLGKTGERVPVLGLGTACGGLGMSDAEAIELYEKAIDRGVTYLDTAPGYERAQRQLGHAGAAPAATRSSWSPSRPPPTAPSTCVTSTPWATMTPTRS